MSEINLCRYCTGACTCPPVTVVPSAEDDPTLKCEYAFEATTNVKSKYKKNQPNIDQRTL